MIGFCVKLCAMRKTLIIGSIILLVLAGVYLSFRFWASTPSKPLTVTAFLAAVQQERQKAGESTDIQPDKDFWYKSSVIYTLDVEVFKDSDGNGTGDFKGLIQQLDYLQSLGIDALWLAPFQPTPNLDDGYD